MPQHVAFDMGGETGVVKLRYTWNTVADVERVSGRSILALVFGTDTPVLNLRYLYWAARLWNTPDFTLGAAGVELQQFIDDGHDVQALSKAIGETAVMSGIVTPKAHTSGEAQGAATPPTTEPATDPED